jgi:hypothetical protein
MDGFVRDRVRAKSSIRKGREEGKSTFQFQGTSGRYKARQAKARFSIQLFTTLMAIHLESDLNVG